MNTQELTVAMLEQLLPCLAKVEALEEMFITEDNVSEYKALWKKKLAHIAKEITKNLGLDSEREEELQQRAAEILGSVDKGN